ncbi:MAG: hypothetical protein J3K34DRAFT_460671 [Monoraphidium minutum]|nr:MAG: hypothetical protein J3K34DRAFT_460671 [Monoraphidium minutum]
MEAVKEMSERIKERANAAFRARSFGEAADLYTRALELAPGDARLLANRSAAHLALASAAAAAAPAWPKAWYRLGRAAAAAELWPQAAAALARAAALGAPAGAGAGAGAGSRDLAPLLSEAAARAAAARRRAAAQSALRARHAAWAARRAREAGARRALVAQLEQGMAGAEWEVEDWEWRPTWLPAMARLEGAAGREGTGLDGGATLAAPLVDGPGRGCSAAAEELRDNTCLLAGLSHALADLDAPSRAVALARDGALASWYSGALRTALLGRGRRGDGSGSDSESDESEEGCGSSSDGEEAAAAGAGSGRRAGGLTSDGHVLVLGGGGGGVLALLAAAAGAARVTLIEAAPLGLRAARRLVEANASALAALGCRVELVPAPLERCALRDAGVAEGAAAGEAPPAESAWGPPLAEGPPDGQHQQQAGGASAAEGEPGGREPREVPSREQGVFWVEGPPADVVVTDLFAHHSLLGLGALPALGAAAARRLVAPGAALVPAAVAVRGALAEVGVPPAAGFDLEPALRHFKWHPGGAAGVDAASEPGLALLSPPARLGRLDLQPLLRAAAAAAWRAPPPGLLSSGGGSAGAAEQAAARFERAALRQLAVAAPAAVVAAADGRTDAALLWLEFEGGGGRRAASAPAGGPGALLKGDTAAAAAGACAGEAAASASIKQALAYFDAPMPVARGGAARLRVVAAQEGTSLAAALASAAPAAGGPPAPALGLGGWPRHALLAGWHWPMLADEARNSAFDAAIRMAVAATRLRKGSGAPVRVLDLGAGSGLLSLMAVSSQYKTKRVDNPIYVRTIPGSAKIWPSSVTLMATLILEPQSAGATEVVAVESVRHLCEAAEVATALSGVRVVHKDARFLDSNDLAEPADVLVFEVFDCGLIGEGALHIAAAARARGLLAPGGTILPARAAVYAQPIEFGRLGRLAHHGARAGGVCVGGARAGGQTNFDLSPLNAYAWGGPAGDYRAADLAAGAGGAAARTPPWAPLAPPQRAFAFDFAADAPAAPLAPAAVNLAFAAAAAGACNALATWLELDLTGDGSVRLTTSPYATSGGDERAAGGAAPVYAPSWQQAVHPLLGGPRRVAAGDAIRIAACHDTYSLSFAFAAQPGPDGQPQPAAGSGGGGSGGGQRASAAAGPQGPGSEGGGGAAADDADAVWAARHAEVRALQAALGRQAAQQPQRHRAVVRAALALAARPAAARADAAQAAALCAQMMMGARPRERHSHCPGAAARWDANPDGPNIGEADRYVIHLSVTTACC